MYRSTTSRCHVSFTNHATSFVQHFKSTESVHSQNEAHFATPHNKCSPKTCAVLQNGNLCVSGKIQRCVCTSSILV